MKLETACKLAERSADTTIVISTIAAGGLSAMKLIDKLDWSWATVLAPAYVGIPLGLIAPLCFLVWIAFREASKAE